MTSDTLMHIRLTKHDQKFIDEMVKKGHFSNKSDVMRTALRLYKYSEICNQMKTFNPEKRDAKQILKDIREIRKGTYKRMYEANE